MTYLSADETIFALATPPGRGGVGMVRLSGAVAAWVLTEVTAAPLPPPRRASVRSVRDPATGEVLDHGLVLWFPAPASFTGEDVAELHMHGGRAVIGAMLAVLARLPGVRPAKPGEFSRRAFLNGKMDLTVAEGLADLVAAETAAQRRQALQQMDGALARLYEEWRERLVRLLAHWEAVIDFPEDDLPSNVITTVHKEIIDLAGTLRTHLDDGKRGEQIRDGIHVVLIGPPNAGKSSLLNRLARRDAAIVAPTAGTTRDVIEVPLDLGGYPVLLADTAGVRTETEAVEAEGVRRALARAATADLKLVVLDGGTWPALDAQTVALIDENAVIVLNKSDLLATDLTPEILGRTVVPVSALTGAGLPVLEDRLQHEVERRWTTGAAPVVTRLRHRLAVQGCLEALERAQTAPLPELAAEDLRLAARALGEITGRIAVDDVLDVVFRDFCIGK
ncbi:MAG: tRNA modification GTPase [Rhodospirillaceae bacterium]|nr:MAG: tRNA modification GTPase [Rhodospirillaceae bacterium]